MDSIAKTMEVGCRPYMAVSRERDRDRKRKGGREGVGGGGGRESTCVCVYIKSFKERNLYM